MNTASLVFLAMVVSAAALAAPDDCAIRIAQPQTVGERGTCPAAPGSWWIHGGMLP
jgi:hypothetical protein